MDKIGLFSCFQALKTDAHFASSLGPFPWSFSLIFQAVTPYGITGRKFYCQNHKKFPEAPEKIFRGSSKNFSVFHEKFWPVSHEIISPVILKSFGLSQDLPLSQNGQNLRRGKLGIRAKRIDRLNKANLLHLYIRF